MPFLRLRMVRRMRSSADGVFGGSGNGVCGSAADGGIDESEARDDAEVLDGPVQLARRPVLATGADDDRAQAAGRRLRGIGHGSSLLIRSAHNTRCSDVTLATLNRRTSPRLMSSVQPVKVRFSP